MHSNSWKYGFLHLYAMQYLASDFWFSWDKARSSITQGYAVAHYMDACPTCTLQMPRNCLWRGRDNRRGEVRIKMHAVKKEEIGEKKKWKVEGGYIWPGSQKCFGCRYALPTHLLHTDARSGLHQSSVAVVSTYCAPTGAQSGGTGSPKHSTTCPCKAEKELNVTQKAEVVATCIPLLARGLWCVLWEWWQ